MSAPDNRWQQLWDQAKPLAANEQPALFDYTKEAEKALNYLENLPPADFLEQMILCLVTVFFQYLEDIELGRISALCSSFKHFKRGFETICRNGFPHAECEKFLSLVRSLELAVSQAFSLTEKIGVHLCNQVFCLDKEQITKDFSSDEIADHLFNIGDDMRELEAKEFILSTALPRPFCHSRSLPQTFCTRMCPGDKHQVCLYLQADE